MDAGTGTIAFALRVASGKRQARALATLRVLAKGDLYADAALASAVAARRRGR